MPKNISQKVMIKAAPAQVYQALMNEKKHAAFTGAKARIVSKVGGSFSVYEKYCFGVNVELAPNRRIVQAWRAADWDAGVYSIATFELDRTSEGYTELYFTQTGVPDDQYKDIKQGWNDFYWKPLKAYLE